MTKCITSDKWRGESLSAGMAYIYALEKSDPHQLDLLGASLKNKVTS